MNASEHCEGVFTRIHKYKQTIEKSVLDYVFISSDLEEYFTSMQIVEEKHLHHGVALNMVKDIPTFVLLSFAWLWKLLSRSTLLKKLRSRTSMILRVGKSLVNLQSPQLFSVICGELVTILKLVTKNGRTIWIGYHTYAFRKRESDAPRVSIIRKLDSSLKRESSWKDKSQIPFLSIRS